MNADAFQQLPRAQRIAGLRQLGEAELRLRLGMVTSAYNLAYEAAVNAQQLAEDISAALSGEVPSEH